MTIKAAIWPLVFMLGFSCESPRDVKDYLGGWAGQITEPQPFFFTIGLSKENDAEFLLELSGQDGTTTIPLRMATDGYFRGAENDQLTVAMEEASDGPIVFFQIGHHLAPIKLEASGSGHWVGEWNLLLHQPGFDPTFYLYLEENDNGDYSASTFFKEPSFHYMFGVNFGEGQDTFGFRDMRSEIEFNGVLRDDEIDLTLSFLNESTGLTLQRLPVDEWRIGSFDKEELKEGVANTRDERFDKLLADVHNDTLAGTHAILISQNEKVILEAYFDGFDQEIPHDTRSLSKSFAGAMTGIAIDRGFIADEFAKVQDFLKMDYPDIDWSSGKDSIELFHLLTMSSGLDAIDFGLDRMSYANEGAYQNEDDWTRHVLSAPMVFGPGEQANYGSGNPHLLAPVLANQLDERLEFFIHKNLFGPMEITNYRIQANNKDRPYFGGGWYLCPRDLVKFGQLYLNDGKWKGEQLITEDWIEKSMDQYGPLANTFDKNEYGYLFWHKDYEVNGVKVASVEARGSGGQYLFMIPELQLVAVITSGNYRNNKGFQPERIMEEYVLPEILR